MTGRFPDVGIPDLAWINRRLPIADVAKALELCFGQGGMIHCWHPERHQNGDRTASVGIHKVTNRVKCFGCDTPLIGVVDLVMEVLATDLKGAIRWLEDHFQLHHKPKGKHLESRGEERPYQIGYEGPIELLIKYGIWASLAPPTRAIAPVLLAFAERAEKDTFIVTFSYRGILRNSGVRSFSSVSKAIEQLKGIGWVDFQQTKAPDGVLIRNTAVQDTTDL